ENIALYINNILRSPIQQLGAELYRIKLVESPNNSCEVYAANLDQTSVDKVMN
ncbi:MAG: 6-pyruvoyl tetrahydropterin synthase, partial [Sphaerospermopsis sp. SIO1G2]|nr:6-pyruvoyl tetrahydropterin synthase [Sphaerospermopsis sp. SIO1G2]